VSLAGTVQEARRVAGTMGTWVMHEAARAESHEELVGFVRYCSEGLERQHARARAEAKTAKGKVARAEADARSLLLRTWIGAWRRATRWLLSLDPGQARGVAEAVVRQVEDLPYYVACGHPYLTEEDTAPRVPGRPRVRALATVFRQCSACDGFGWV
jgi:hypothetical protein